MKKKKCESKKKKKIGKTKCLKLENESPKINRFQAFIWIFRCFQLR